MIPNHEQLKQAIPAIKNSKQIETIEKGYSEDKKYIVHMEENKKLLLRVSDSKQYEKKLSEFHILTKLQQYDVKASVPKSIGVIESLKSCYMLLSYIEGEEASECLPQLSEKLQYELGVSAGNELRKMHQYHALGRITSWYERALKKHYFYLNSYKNCGIKIKNDDRIAAFIIENQKYMLNRPNLFKHDDFHPANMIIQGNKYAGTIDFNRYDWGDPIHEFLKVGMFTSQISIPFSVGQINGYYHDRPIPDYFWRLYTLYTAMSMYSSIVWSLKVTPDLVDNMLERLNHVMDDHQGLESMKPRWFTL